MYPSPEGEGFTAVQDKKALENGAKDIASPHTKPWGQTVGYIRDPNGILIEIATPIS